MALIQLIFCNYQIKPCDWQTGKSETLTISNSNNKYAINLIPSDNSAYKKVFDQLITTFKFVNPTSESWQTYNNSHYGISFKYQAIFKY